jgi:hypothetical protein
MRVVVCASLLVFSGCGDDGGSASDAGTTVADAAPSGGALAQTCTGPCATMDLGVSFGATSRSFDRAFFGLTSPAMSDSGEWEIYIENNAGTDDACPTVSSPSPDFLLSLGGFLVPTEIGEASASATLVDFEGALLTDEVFERASAHTVRWVAADLCIACSEGTETDRPERMVAFELDATFTGGTITGHSYATHCDSLDKI